MPTITANSASNAVLDVLRATYKTIYIPYVDAGRELGLAPSTSRNRYAKGLFPIPTIKIGGHRVVSIFDLADYVCQKSPSVSKPTKRGPRFKKDRLAEQGRA